MEAIAILLAFAVGFAMKYGGLCTYAAALQIVEQRRYERLLAFLGAAAWTALIVVPLAWFWGDALRLAGTHHLWLAAMIGGVVLGIGAYLNRGCVFGTFVQLTGGNLSYLATLVGMVAGSVGARLWIGDVAPVASAPALAAVPGPVALFWLLLLAGFALSRLLPPRWVGAGWALRSRRDLLVMLTLGIGGGLLFAAVRGWDFAAVLNGVAYRLADLQPHWPAQLAVFCTLAMVTGGISAAVVRQTFQLRPPRLRPMLGSLAGGFLMGAAAIILPGGNDGLLLSGIPALAPHAVVGYLLMVVAMLLVLRWRSNARGYARPAE